MVRWKVATGGKVKMRPWARCADHRCGWTWPEGESTRNVAKHHVATTGHDVLVIIEDRTLYSPTGDGFD